MVESLQRRCESPEIDGVAAWRLSLLSAVVLLVILGLSYAYWAVLFPGGVQSPPAAAIPPAPRLQSAAPDERRATQLQQSAQLDSYGWVDRGAGIAHIPIERAMQLRAQQR